MQAPDVTRLPFFVVSPRVGIAVLSFAAVLGAAIGLLPLDSSAAWLLRVIGGAIVVGIAPGAVAVLAWRPRQSFGVLELIGVSLGVSFAFTQLLTFAALIFHWPVDISLLILTGWLTGHAVVAARRGHTGVELWMSRGEIALAAVLAALGGVLYMIGSPLGSSEDRIHIGIIRRLLHMSSPRIDDIYIVPDIVYTYPFPGTHYMLAMMARIEGIDPMFLYHKMRAFWGMASAVLLYGCGSVVFGNTRIALATTFVAVGFAVNGTFADVPGFYWGQLVPYSHASDVAMGVLLPALLLLAFEFLVADGKRARTFFCIATLASALQVIAVHPREIVQFLVYLAAFVVTLIAFRGSRQALARTAMLVLATLAASLIYLAWHQQAVPTVDTLIAEHRSELRALYRESSWSDLIEQPTPRLRAYMPALESMFYGFNPLVLLASPIVLLLLRRRPLVWFLAGGIVAYLLIIRFPFLAIPYVYLTYFEILQTPVRNVIFFVHLLTGVCIYLLAAGLSRLAPLASALLAALVAILAADGVERVGPAIAERPDLLFASTLVMYADVAAVWWLWRLRERAPSEAWIESPRRHWPLIMLILVVPLLGTTYRPESSLLKASWSNSAGTPAALRASLPCLARDVFCPPPDELIRFVQARVPVDSVFAVDVSDEYQSSLFVPQQMDMWSGDSEGLLLEEVFPRYFRHYERTSAKYGAQPLFNDRETRAERLSFIRDLGITHVLVNPRLHEMMSAVLAASPDLFARRYDDGRWALYEVLTP